MIRPQKTMESARIAAMHIAQHSESELESAARCPPRSGQNQGSPNFQRQNPPHHCCGGSKNRSPKSLIASMHTPKTPDEAACALVGLFTNSRLRACGPGAAYPSVRAFTSSQPLNKTTFQAGTPERIKNRISCHAARGPNLVI
jgi:hypothetical protein